jgi:hypothetical protein
MFIELALVGQLIAGTPKVYVDGMGWVRSYAVGHCLVVVGVPHVDELHDQSWEEFQDCVNDNGGFR